MRRPAKTLIAGTLLAIPTSLLICGVATSQSTVLNGQVQLGDVFATQNLTVVDVSDQTTATTVASGNTFSGAVTSGSVDVQSTQTLSANVAATTDVAVSVNSGAVTALSTSATGNDSEADSLGGGALTGTFAQTTGAVNVTADSLYHGATARTGAIAASVQAVANSAGFGVVDSGATATITQSSQALTQADGGGELQYTPGVATFSAVAVSNNVTSVGTGNAHTDMAITQTMDGQRTQASNFVAAGNAQDISGQTTATANNVSVTNEGGSLYLNTDQSNSAYLRSEIQVSSFEFGAGAAYGNGVGNSVVAGNFGPTVVMNNNQSNTGGGVEVISSFTGDTGYDSNVSATAVGNGVTGYACSSCAGQMTIASSQFNSADVGATAATTITGTNRSVTGVAAATGNTASFYVSAPHP